MFAVFASLCNSCMLLLYYFTFFGSDNGHDQIDEYNAAVQTHEESQHKQQTDDGRIHVEIFTKPGANPAIMRLLLLRFSCL